MATMMAAPRVAVVVIADAIAMVEAMLTAMPFVAAGDGDGDDDGDDANIYIEDYGCASDRD